MEALRIDASDVDEKVDPKEVADASATGTAAAKMGSSDFEAADIVRHVDYLCRKELGGRMTGSEGERKATAYVAAYPQPIWDASRLQTTNTFKRLIFPGRSQTAALEMHLHGRQRQTHLPPSLKQIFGRSLFQRNTKVEEAAVVFAGYGIVAPKTEKFDEYDSYVHLDVKDKWVLVFRFVPEDVSPKQRQHLKFYAGLRKKLFHARQNGAIGLLVVSGPTSQVREQLVPLRNDFAPSGSSIAAISVSDAVAEKWLSSNDKELAELQKKFDSGRTGDGVRSQGRQGFG